MAGTVELSPFWRVTSADAEPEPSHGRYLLRIEKGSAFGSGAHPTTQLCLLAIGHLLRPDRPRPPEPAVLDVGTGSGILAIAAARLGCRVDAVDIDPTALESARRNAELNEVAPAIGFAVELPPPDRAYHLVVANILVSVLLDLAPALASRVERPGHLVLSGLVATDVPVVVARYRLLLPGATSHVHRREAWQLVRFSLPRETGKSSPDD